MVTRRAFLAAAAGAVVAGRAHAGLADSIPRLAATDPHRPGVFARTLCVAAEPPLPKLMALLPDLAQQIGAPDAAAPVLQAAKDALAAIAARQSTRKPCLLIEIGDPRHVRVFGTDSLFGGALVALGLTNAWADTTRFAFNAPVPMERLADFPDVRFVIIGTVPPQAARSLQTGALWTHLPPVRRGHVHHLPEMNAFGGLPSALRFAQALTDTLAAA